MYRLLPTVTSPTGYVMEPSFIVRIADDAYIPFDAGNTDYAEYLDWIAAGNTPLPADGA